jgi:NADPH-dependent ferric siderophore reductase
VSDREQFTAVVHENVPLCREHYRLILSVKAFPNTEPGQFIQIACRDLPADKDLIEDVDWQPDRRIEFFDRDLVSSFAFLRRPFSLAGRTDTRDGVLLEIIHRVVGIGTDWLASLEPGDHVGILGPLGNRFQLPPPDHTAVLVGGGVGIPPMLYLADALKDRPAVAFCGATTKDLLALTIKGESDPLGITPKLCIDEFSRQNIPSIVSTDDGTYGFYTPAAPSP